VSAIKPTLEWGKKNDPAAAVSAYEVQVIGGRQQFRLYPDGKKHFNDIPFPPLDSTFVSGGEWSELPEMVGKELHLKINRAADATVETKRIKVFQYHADVEDEVCTWSTILDSSRRGKQQMSLVTARFGQTTI
jgi:hypothetical protein